MMPSVTPRPVETCVFGWLVLVGSWMAACVAAFLVGAAITRRWSL